MNDTATQHRRPRPAGRRRRSPSSPASSGTTSPSSSARAGCPPSTRSARPPPRSPPPTCPASTPRRVAGHSRQDPQRSVAGDRNLLVFLSRTHFYEGKGVAAVVHGVRTAAAAGCRAIVLTNGCGGLKETCRPRARRC